jgi:dodecin
MAQSPEGWDAAAQAAVKEASKTLRNIRSIYIKEFTAEVDNGKITNYRLNAKVTFDLERE